MHRIRFRFRAISHSRTNDLDVTCTIFKCNVTGSKNSRSHGTISYVNRNVTGSHVNRNVTCTNDFYVPSSITHGSHKL